MAVPGSKSATQRALLAAALARGTSRIRNALSAEDPQVLADALRALGASILASADGTLVVTGLGGLPRAQAPVSFDLRENGTAWRMLAAVVGLGRGQFRLDGRGRLPERPLGDLRSALAEAGAVVEFAGRVGCVPCQITGCDWRGVPAEFQLSVRDTSQGASGLLLALAAAGQPAVVQILGGAGNGYLRLTLQALVAFGANVVSAEVGADLVVSLLSMAPLVATQVVVPGDASAATFLMAAAVVTRSRVCITGLQPDDPHPDLGLCQDLARVGVRSEWTADGLLVTGADRRGGGGEFAGLDARPDAVPALVAALASCPGTWRLTGLGRLRSKESDRLAALVGGLQQFGVPARVLDADLELVGGGPMAGPVPRIDACGDHRIAMAFSVLALGRDGGGEIQGAGCVAKSWPGFFAALPQAVPGAVVTPVAGPAS